MTIVYPPVSFRVEPHAIPELRTAFDRALNILDPHLRKMSVHAYIRGPWLGDPDSQRLVDFYNSQVMDAPDGPFHALLAYRDQLKAIRDQLAEAEAEYRRVEGENSDLWGKA